MDRLGEEFVGPRLDSADAIGEIGLPGHQNDWSQPRRRIRLESAADFEPVHARHRDVEEYDVGLMLLHGVECGGAVTGADHVMAVGEQKLAEQ
jgi:hypothetical protein